jgi:hypothetical protein
MAQPGPKTAAQPKTVPITVNKDGSCSPDPAQARNNDWIIWDGTVNELQFPDENPFDDGKNKKFKPKLKYKVSKLQGKFKYSVITPNGTFDPDIEIIPPP